MPAINCERCLDTGMAFVPHSDEARERCDCPAAFEPVEAGGCAPPVLASPKKD